MASEMEGTPVPTARVAWIDYAKGICIIAVVCMYAAYYVGEVDGAGWMQYWVDFARPFRMPDFFLISGLFLARTINRPWRDYLDKKIVHFFYFYVLWTTIYFVTALALTNQFEGKVPLWIQYARWLSDSYRMLWFIFMLPVFFLITRLLRPVPWWIVLPIAASLQILQPESGWIQIDRICERYVYFYAGYAFAPLAFRVASWAWTNRGQALAALATWAIVNEAIVLAERHEDPGVSLVLGFAGATAVVTVASLLHGFRSMDWLRYLGQNSIVVFLAFFLPMVAAAKLIWRLELINDIGTQALVITIVGVAASVVLRNLARRTPLRFLFERPKWARLSPTPPDPLVERVPAKASPL